MDQALVASMRKNLEAKSTAELLQALESKGKSPEELEAIRQILEERRKNGNRFAFALASALVMGILAATGFWWQGAPEGLIALAGVVGAILGFGAWYSPGLVGPG